MNFRLEPWEIPPEADASNLSVPIEFGPIDWAGTPTMISALWLELPSGEALAFFRPHNGEVNFVVTRFGNWPAKCLQKKANSKILGEIIRASQENQPKSGYGFGRLFYYHGESLIFRKGVGHGQSQDMWQQEVPLQIPFDWMSEPSSQVFQWLQEQWAIPTSNVRFYYDWNRRNQSERINWLGEFVPRWNELQELMRAVSRRVELPTGVRNRWFLNHVDTHNHSPELLARLQPWRELFEVEFSFEPLPDSYPEFLRRYFQMASSHVQVEGVESSAHQQLEAELYLRDWLQRNAPEHLYLVQ